MAAMDVPRDLALNSLLCFVMNTRSKHPNKVIKAIVSDFYDTDTISKAKDRLIQDVTNIPNNGIKVPRQRRNSDNKQKQDIEDILSLLEVIDENGGLAYLPRYVTDNFHDLPVVHMDADGMSVILSKLVEIKESVNGIGIGCTCLQPSLAPLIQPVRPGDTEGELSQQEEMGRENTWGSVTSDTFQEPSYNVRKRRRRQRNSTISPLAPASVDQSNISVPGDVPAGNSTVPLAQDYAKVTATNINPLKSKRMIGVANVVNSQNKLKSARPYVKKAIFAVYNVCAEENVESVSQFIAELCGANPLSVFKIGALESREINDDKPKAFRVCIDNQFSSKFLNPQAWASGIVVKKWTFKSKKQEANNVNTNPNNAGEN